MTEDLNEINHPDNQAQSADAASNEPSEDQKREIAKWVAEGIGLSDIQKKINTDFGIVMTYMDVRFLVDDLNLILQDLEEEPPKVEEENSDTGSTPSVDDPLSGAGGVSIELDTVNPPGAMASGTVVFSDGQSKKWTLDQRGLGLSGGDADYKPSDEDVVEFQKQLDTALRGRGF